MAEKSIPDLPFVLAEQTWPNFARSVLSLKPGIVGAGKEGLRVAIDRYMPDESAPGTEKFENGLYVGGIDPAELMRNLAAFVPEVEPVSEVAIAARVSNALGAAGLRVFAPVGGITHGEAGRAIAEQLKHDDLYAHPPVTAEPAPVPEAANEPSDDGLAKAIEEVLVLAAPSTSPATKALYILESIKAAGYVVTAEPATAPSGDLVEGMNVEEWAHKADVEHQAFRNLSDVLDAAWDALKSHGFTSDTLESQRGETSEGA